MKTDFSFDSVGLINPRKEDPAINHRIDDLLIKVSREGDVNFSVVKFFKDVDLFNSLPESIRNSDEELISFIENSGKFSQIISSERVKRFAGEKGLFGEEMFIDTSVHQDGRPRRAEKGYKINIEYLESLGIDAKKVLFFRTTQLSDVPKPEYYWTSDYLETKEGLTAERSPEQRVKAIILVSDLFTINQNEGLIQDSNDDQGLAVRQIGLGTFDQLKVLTKFHPS